MKSSPFEHLLNPDVLKGGLVASLFGSLPAIGTGAEYLAINLIHGIDFATGGRMGENRISAIVSILNINTLWLPLTGFLLLVPAIRNNSAATIVIAFLQFLCAVINFSRGLYTDAFLELAIATIALLSSSNRHTLSNDLGVTDE